MVSLRALSLATCGVLLSAPVLADPLPPNTTYRPLPTQPLSEVKAKDEAEKAAVIQRQQTLFNQRYDLSDKSIPGVMMSRGTKPVQTGVRVKLPSGAGMRGIPVANPST